MLGPKDIRQGGQTGNGSRSSSETPPPLEPDPKRLAAPAEPAASEELVPAPAATTPAPGASSGTVEDGAEFGIEPAGSHPAPVNGGSTPQTWGGAPSSPPSKAKRPPPRTP